MQPLPGLPAVQPPPDDRRAAWAAACPLCGAALVPLRGLLRCSRCAFTLCEGCEGEVAED